MLEEGQIENSIKRLINMLMSGPSDVWRKLSDAGLSTLSAVNNIRYQAINRQCLLLITTQYYQYYHYFLSCLYRASI